MAQDDPENSDKSSRADGAEGEGREGAARIGKFAHLARIQRSANSPPGEAAAGGDSGAPAADNDAEAPREDIISEPAKKSGVTFSRILLALIALLAAAIAGVFALKDTNESLRALTDPIENAAREPLAALREMTSGLLDPKKAAPPPSVAVKEPAPVSEAAPAPSPAVEPDRPVGSNAESARPLAETAPKTPVETPTKEALVEPPPKTPLAPAEASAPREAAVQSEDREALLKRIGEIERLAQSALKTAEDARARSESAAKPAADGEALTERDYLVALEGRIDELGAEIKTLREKLDAPKSELRAPQESAEIKNAPGKKGGAAELVVVAQSLSQEIEKGRPYSVELAALSSLGADPELLAALAPSAEKGVMTHEQLLHGFDPVAKRLLASDAPKSTSSYLDRVLHATARLVRVRPLNEPPSTTVSDRVDAIRSALQHNDAAAAAAAFDLLPDTAKTEESAFGEFLRHRRDAEKASAELLSGAITALGRNKS